jgi:multiple sugar transport system ATP-binding protein
MTQVSLRDIDLGLGGRSILHRVSIEVPAGSFCVLVGPSGCGKSTLLRLVAGLERPDRGDVLIDGRSVLGTPSAQRGVAMVFQGYALYPHMTVFDNMAFALRRAGVPRADVERRVQAAAGALQLRELLQRKPAALSGGQRQRVALGRAMVKQPRVFLFDEPLSNLDAALRVHTRAEIARLHRELAASSMIYVTHDQVEAMTLADQVVLLQPSGDASLPNVVQVGSPLELYRHPATLFAAQFIGSPAMNLLPAEAVHDASPHLSARLFGHTIATAFAPDALPAGAACTLGARPEHVRIGSGVFRGRCEHIDELGEHAYLHLSVGDGASSTLVAKVSERRAAVGDALPFDLPAADLHVFRRDGSALRRADSPA